MLLPHICEQLTTSVSANLLQSINIFHVPAHSIKDDDYLEAYES